MIIRILGDVTDAKNKMRELDSSVKNLEKNIETESLKSVNSFSKIGGALTTLGSGMQRIGAGLTTYVSIPLVLIGAKAMQFSIDFEQAFTNVRKVMDVTAEELAEYGTEENFFSTLKRQINELARELPITQQELSAIMETAGRLGIRGQGALTAFTDATAKLTITTGIASEELSMLLGRLVNIMGIEVESEMMKLADTVTHLGNNTATTEKALLNFATRMGGAGKLIGLTTPQVLGIAAAADSVGIKAERGGTAMTKIFMAINSEISKASVTTKEFNNYVRDTAVATAEAQRRVNDATKALNSFESSGERNNETLKKLRDELEEATAEYKGLVEVSGDMQTSIAVASNELYGFAGFLGMTKAEFKTLGDSQNGAIIIFQRFIDELQRFKAAGGDVASKMRELGLGDSRLMAAVLNMSEANNDAVLSSSDLVRALGLAEAAWEGYGNAAGATDVEVAKFLDTTENQIKIFKNSLNSLADVFASKASGSLKEFLKTVNAALDSLVRTIETMSASQIDSIIKTFVGLIALGPGLSIAGGFLKTFGTAFSGLGIIVGGATTALSDFHQLVGTSNLGKALSKGGQTATAIATNAPNVVANLASEALGTSDAFLQPDGLAPNNIVMKQTAKGPRYIDQTTGRFVSKQAAQAASMGPSDAVTSTAIGSKLISGSPTAVTGAAAMGGVGSGVAPKKVSALSQMGAEVGDSIKGMGSGISNFFATLAIKFEFLKMQFPLITSLFAKLIPIFTFFAGKLLVIATVLAALSGGIALFFVLTGQGADDVTAVFNTLFNKVNDFFMSMGSLVENAGNALPAFAEKFGPVFDEVLRNLIIFGQMLLMKLSELLPEILALGVEFVLMLINGFVAALPQLFDGAIALVMSLIEAIWTMLPSIVDSGFKLIVGLINGIIKAIPHVVKAVMDLTGALLGFLWKVIADGSLLTIGVKLFLGLIDGILSIGGTLLNAVGEIIGVLLKPFANAGKWLWDAGRNLISGLLNGINSKAADLGKMFVDKLPSWIQVPFKLAMGIKSPSRVFKGYGEMMGEGLVLGMDSMQKDVMDATKEMANATFFEPAAIQRAVDINTDGTVRADYSGIAEAFALALESVGLSVYMDGKDVTDVVSRNLVTQQRKARA